ncbi:putative vacuolar proton translocating ATPase subunit A [Besnoitia besnoiti]|uniref:V-type proton ATPase subunit a n=1 Tax=Besnoitia besnoiti TaxID=94643 RepID=A0A2A9MMG7_BESBE|nr:putative vacuolar proton translocating ATPase subunit A [Besnoitia besnoiti]PFH38534.1 putative vacuolar proton translocating ATPase subunit A [Besnoitia besnoiti]
MTTLRSEPMLRGTLVLPSALPVARGCLDALGRQGSVHFMDMNAHSLTRQFNTYIQRIDEMERIIRFLEEEVNRLQDAGAKIIIGPEGPQNFLDNDKGYQLDKVEEALNRLHAQFVRFKSNNADLIQQKNAALEEKCVMQTAVQQLRGASLKEDFGAGARITAAEGSPAGQSEEEVAKALLRQDDGKDGIPTADDPEQGLTRPEGGASGSSVSTVAGMVATSDIGRFQRMLFRTTRGNAFCFFQSAAEKLIDSHTGKEIEKGVFVIYYQGATHSLLHEKIVKVCAAFDAKPYEWPHSAEEASARLEALQSLLDDKERALAAYEKYFLGEISLLLEVTRSGGSSLLEEWKMFCQKEKAVYVTLNQFHGRDMTLRCDCWIPQDKEEEVRALLKDVSAESAGDEQASAFLLIEKGRPTAMPPTYFKTTEFTEPAQIMVDTYGVPRYQEANPAVLTTITFPFLFGVMYGDIGHGLCVMLMGLWLMIRAKALQRDRSSAFHDAVKYRYMIFLMGFFAVFGGFMYNDWFALGVDIFGSRWTAKGGTTGATNITLAKKDGDFPYPFGFDPAWKGAANELLFTNSFKMKFSVIVGFVQMFAGVLLKGSNAIFFREPLDFIFEFIPQVLFICSLVGYMDFLIVYKWVTPEERNKPNLINTIINMCMLSEVKSEDEMYSNQQLVERALFLLMVISIPLMLIPKPLILCSRMKKNHPRSEDKQQLSSGKTNSSTIELERAPNADHGTGAGGAEGDSEHPVAGGALRKQASAEEADDDMLAGAKVEDHEEEHEGPGDIFIHQMIETIEFILGTISNTASYLRLWALSLAHQQLALVFYTQTVVRAIELTDNVAVVTVALFFIFAAYACITFAVILCMDFLEVSLHALRLQWVEFQNKFFKGDGYKFAPLYFIKLLQGEEA